MNRWGVVRLAVVCAVGVTLVSGPRVSRAQEEPADRFSAALALVEQQLVSEARAAFEGILAEYDTPENRANIEYDSLLAGSRYYLGET